MVILQYNCSIASFRGASVKAGPMRPLRALGGALVVGALLELMHVVRKDADQEHAILRLVAPPDPAIPSLSWDEAAHELATLDGVHRCTEQATAAADPVLHELACLDAETMCSDVPLRRRPP